LVAALSLGIDLGFGQPMEHVLRQCLIALRLADRIGLPDQERSAVYFTALLINVGCHSDAHEQAKWFGDDIALKSGKYDYEFRSVRGAVAGVRRIGSGHPAQTILSGLDTVATWGAVIDADPALTMVLSGERFDGALAAIANFVDLKSAYTLGHARAVADLAARRPNASSCCWSVSRLTTSLGVRTLRWTIEK
jgi:hypothetical protein